MQSRIHGNAENDKTYLKSSLSRQMFVVSLLSQKGGTGKTTLAIQLAVAAMLDGHTVIIVGMDPQRSATWWGEIRADAQPNDRRCLPEP